jgi:hypothetical protein
LKSISNLMGKPMIENQRFGSAGLEAAVVDQGCPPEIGPASPYRGACSHRPQVLRALMGIRPETRAWALGVRGAGAHG